MKENSRIQIMYDKNEKSMNIANTKDISLAEWLEFYYTSIYEPYQDMENVFPKELLLPLEDRNTEVLKTLDQYIFSSADTTGESDKLTPLMYSVANADAAITEYLLLHGADPKFEVFPGEKGFPIWYYDELDIAILNEDPPYCQDYIEALLATAKVLATTGDLGSYSGHCLKVDTKKREISVSPVEYLY